MNNQAVPLDNSASSQRQRIKQHIKKHGSISTLEARQVLGICHPGLRCMELRRDGINLQTIWVNELDSVGVVHRIARYILKESPQLSLFYTEVEDNGD